MAHPSALTSLGGSGDERMVGEPVTAARPVHPYVHVVIVAVIGAVAVLAWLLVFEVVNEFLWENELVTTNPWLFPVICLPFSLLAGLLVKYRHAPTTLDESLLDSLAGDVTKIEWRALPVNIVMAWVSLFSGAVLGPEGGIGGIGSKIAVLYGEKVGIPVEHRSRLVFSTLASAYNGLVANPLFTGVLGTELIADPEKRSAICPPTSSAARSATSSSSRWGAPGSRTTSTSRRRGPTRRSTFRSSSSVASSDSSLPSSRASCSASPPRSSGASKAARWSAPLSPA
jgi:H+/Cl- antiporter ClcA